MTRGSAAPLKCGSVMACLRAGLSVLLLMCSSPAPALAQGEPTPRVVVPDTVSAAVAAQTPLRISITPSSAIPRNAFVRIRGLPPMAALSDGHSIAPGAWAVALSALTDLRVAVPAAAQGRSTLTITLVNVDGGIIAEAQSTLVVGGSPLAGVPASGAPLRPAPAEQSAAVSPEAKGAPLAALKPEDRERAMRLLKRGQAFVEDSNVAEARLLFEKAADLGLAEAAMALAATFDEPELAKAGVRGIPADPKEARRWYERAAQLGAREAQQRLQRLGAK